jgi:hypothetical protein
MSTLLAKALTLIAIFFVSTPRAYAENPKSWTTSVWTDRFTDKKNPSFVLQAVNTDVPPSLGPRQTFLMLSCPYIDWGEGKLRRFRTGIIYFTPELQFFNTSITYRFDKQPNKSFYRPALSTSISFGLHSSPFLTSLSKSKTLLIRVWSKSVGAIEAEFDLSESSMIKKEFLAACGPR